jgi:hypothetical protein
MKNIFIITPIRSDINFEKKKVMLLHESKKNNVNLHFADMYMKYGLIDIKKLDRLYKKVNFFIADLSLERPSCYYEIAIVKMLKKPIFITAKEGTIIHQYLDEHVKFYKNFDDYKNIMNTAFSAVNKKKNYIKAKYLFENKSFKNIFCTL